MRALLLVLLFGLSVEASAKVVNMYSVSPESSKPILVPDAVKIKTATGREKLMDVRIKMTKYVITKTEQGPKVKFTPVCEIDVLVPIEDLSSGGLISENNMGACESEYNGKRVVVVVSGMIYDSEGYDFSDESKGWMRNFFAHLSLSSNEIIFGLGDFNLDSTRDPDMTYLSSALSVDPHLGSTKQRREGFTARVRYRTN